jgi:hypothetical protein
MARASARVNSMRWSSHRPAVVIIRGPIGAGKTALMRGLEGRPPWRFFALDCDAVSSHHPGDPEGTHLDTEWDVEIDILALHSKLILGRGLNLVLDPGLLLSARKLDRFLRGIGRARGDPRVALIRLTVPTAEAIRRKSDLPSRYVRASHQGWVTRPVPGEIVIDTRGLSAVRVLRLARSAIDATFAGHAGRGRETFIPMRRSPRMAMKSA